MKGLANSALIDEKMQQGFKIYVLETKFYLLASTFWEFCGDLLIMHKFILKQSFCFLIFLISSYDDDIMTQLQNKDKKWAKIKVGLQQIN